MTVVTLSALETALGTPEPVSRGTVTVAYMAGRYDRFTNVDGAKVTFPAEIRVGITDGQPDAELDLEPTAGICCARIEVTASKPRVSLTRFVAIPASGPVEFGDLVDVDPDSYAPADPTPTLIETIDQRIAEVGVSDEQIADAVGDYLLAHPPSSGTAYPQASPLGSWVITHSLGRVPNVAVYVGGILVDTDVAATSTTVTITFPTPTAGVAVLN